MSWTVSIFTFLVFGAAAFAVIVGIAALRNRPDPLALPLAITMFAVAAWAIPDAISFGFSTAEQVAFWQQVSYLGTVVAPVGYLVIAVKYVGSDEWLSRRIYALLGVIPVITVVAVWTNSFHLLFWRSLAIEVESGAAIFLPDVGPLYWLNLGYLYLVTAIALLLLALIAFRPDPIYRKQASLMFVGGITPLVTNVLLNFGIVSTQTPDLTTTALAVSGVMFALALYHFDLLEIRPVARDHLLTELEDGVVVIGPNGRIRDFNPTATAILGELYIDQPAEEVLPSDLVPDGGEIVVERDGTDRTYRTRATELTDHRGRTVGRIVYLNDITDLVRREQRISVLNRILRHNIRNELNIGLGHLELVGDTLPDEDRQRLARAVKSMSGVISVADKARYVERSIKRDDSTVPVEVGGAIDQAVEELSERYPDVEIDWARTGTVTVDVVDETLFVMAVYELAENAIQHHDQDTPTVTISMERANGSGHVRVVDTGPGIPPEELDVLTARRETPLEHASGIGLWLVRWATSLSGGHLSFDENEPRGSVVTMTLPVTDA